MDGLRGRRWSGHPRSNANAHGDADDQPEGHADDTTRHTDTDRYQEAHVDSIGAAHAHLRAPRSVLLLRQLPPTLSDDTTLLSRGPVWRVHSKPRDMPHR